MAQYSGEVIGINGNMVSVKFTTDVLQNEVGYIVVGQQRLKSEVIRINGSVASMQVFEMTGGVKVGDPVEFTGELLSVELGPGLLSQIYDGLQNPLPELAQQCGFFLQRGVYLQPIADKEWEFTPTVSVGDTVYPADTLGTVQEGIFTHRIMVPFDLAAEGWKVVSIVDKGTYQVRQTIAVIADSKGNEKSLSMVFTWPVKKAITAYEQRLRPTEPLVTKIRIIDTFLPIAKGGTYCIPGPFGAGKTVLQQMTSRNADVDIVIIAACGERAGEVVETLKEFPELIDPRTGKTLMERTVIICNTSSMPVAAREASVYTAVTIAEYYRQMGLNVLLLADSTSRWAQAMREMSGRLEEIPGEEAFPAYLESVIASFYERAGIVQLRDGSIGSVTIGGTVSPAGGNFEEPVTQATLKVVGAFHGLSRERSDARKYPAIDPLDSWSKYPSLINGKKVDYARQILFNGNEVSQMMKVVGEEGTSLQDYITYLKGELLDSVYLQQNSFDPVDFAAPIERQTLVFDVLFDALASEFALEEKHEARLFINELRQLFLDWNNTPLQEKRFGEYQKNITELVKSRFVAYERRAAQILEQ
ncbi:MAG: V-type ATP synthase subunit A [Sphaerochaetaceae bacterium]